VQQATASLTAGRTTFTRCAQFAIITDNSDCDIATFYLGYNINMSSDDEMSDANSSADMFL